MVLRVPGHGTVPAGLIDVTWEDWLAAVRVAAREIRTRIGTGPPLLLVGYSNGGAQVLKYALDVVEGSGDPKADRIVLLSPMIGVTRFAWLARVISLLGPLPAFEKARWLDIYPEYNPFKYNSFPANAGLQTWRLTTTMQAQIARLAEAGRGGELPPMLTFHSLVDATVSTPAIVHALYDVIADQRSELVLFDINRSSGLVPFIQPADAALVTQLASETPRKYRRTLITNADTSSLDVVERTAAPSAADGDDAPAGAVVAARHLFPVARRHSVPDVGPRVWPRGDRTPASNDSPRANESARRTRGADGAVGYADAPHLQSVLLVSGRPDGRLDRSVRTARRGKYQDHEELIRHGLPVNRDYRKVGIGASTEPTTPLSSLKVTMMCSTGAPV